MARTAGHLQREVQELTQAAAALAEHTGIPSPAQELLAELRGIATRLDRYRPQQVPDGALQMEVALARVAARIAAERSWSRWMQTRPVARMIGYQALWLTAIALAAFGWWNHQQRWGVTVPREVEVLLGCMLWAATGACFSSVIALVRRRADRSLLPDFETWHFLKPLVGAFVGCLVYLILAGGIHFFNANQAGLPSAAYSVFTAVANRAFLAYLLSALMGYQERSFFARIEVLIKVLLGLEPPVGPPAPAAPGPYPCACCCGCCGSDHPDQPRRKLPADPDAPVPD